MPLDYRTVAAVGALTLGLVTSPSGQIGSSATAAGDPTAATADGGAWFARRIRRIGPAFERSCSAGPRVQEQRTARLGNPLTSNAS